MNRILHKGMQVALLALFGVSTTGGAAAAEYTLLVEPSYNVKRAVEVYQPLA